MNAHIFHTQTLCGIVSISVTAEGLATRDCAGLSRHGPDFTGYKGSRLPLVSNSVLDKKKKSFVWKKKKFWLSWQKNCSSAILNTGWDDKNTGSSCNYNLYNVLYLLLYISWATWASLVVQKNGRKSKLKVNRKTRFSYSFNKSSTRASNQSCSTNTLEHVLFGTYWMMVDGRWGIENSAGGFFKPPNKHIHSVVLNFGLSNNASLAGSFCLSLKRRFCS